MGSRRLPRPPDHDWTATSESGVIGADGGGVRVRRGPAEADENPWLGETLWCDWSVPPREVRHVTLLPYPVPYLLHMDHRLLLCGVLHSRLTVELTGSGSVFAQRLRPGGLLALFGHRDASALADQAVPVSRWLGTARGSVLAAALDAAVSPAERAAALQAQLATCATAPDRDGELTRARGVIEAVLRPEKHARIKDAAARHSLSIRSLQRLFNTHLGLSPKAATRRCRLLAAAAALTRRPDAWTSVGPQLGYFDQPHFINDFTRAIGITPATFATQCRRTRDAGPPGGRPAIPPPRTAVDAGA
ncbi:MAG: helix-turn-helix transcriptional regulator [Streptomycetaceae bacterium]|nr:helix-turn-helix transcriptional regulator [Streptomycetaceae bacterium]